MPLVVDLTDVNMYLDPVKLRQETLDENLATVQGDIVLGKLSQVFDETVDWVDRATTPGIVRAAVAQRTAGHLFNRTYSEEAASAASYGSWLVRQADNLTQDLMNGSIVIDGLDAPATSYMAFYPDDDATELGDAPRAFSMGQRF